MRSHGSSKPTVAWAGGMMCSLAYWIGTQASAVVSTRSAMVGSIGAYVSVVDFHRMLANAGIEVKVFTQQGGDLQGGGDAGSADHRRPRRRVHPPGATVLRPVPGRCPARQGQRSR